jgi:hypothetical protein
MQNRAIERRARPKLFRGRHDNWWVRIAVAHGWPEEAAELQAAFLVDPAKAMPSWDELMKIARKKPPSLGR